MTILAKTFYLFYYKNKLYSLLLIKFLWIMRPFVYW